MVPDTPQAPKDGQASSEVTLRAGERVRSARPLKEEEGEKDEELGPELRWVCCSIDTESLKGGQPDEDNGPPVVKRERKVDKNCEELASLKLMGSGFGDCVLTLACQADTITVLVDCIVYMTHGGAHKKGKDKGHNVMAMRPDADIDSIERRKKGEAPTDAIDDEFLAGVGKLVENETEKEEVNERPDEEGPRGWSEVGLLSRVVHILRPAGVSEQ